MSAVYSMTQSGVFSVTQSEDRPAVKKMATIEAQRLRDGGIEILLKESTKKYANKNWHTTIGTIRLTADQFDALIKAMEVAR